MCSDAVVSVKNVSKLYMIYKKPEDRLKQMLVPHLKRMIAPILGRFAPVLRDADMCYFNEFWALRDISIALKKNETLGIIGQNGSGKSTLLQIICGTLYPTAGASSSHGRIAALLELGAGFNPDFTGRENIFLNASIYGLSNAEIKERLDTIIDFAEIGEHIDQPVSTYSSGMFVRLAFSVIANIDADILIIDEALAVGDAYFQQKCMRFLRKFQENGSIIFVSHDTGAMMNFCDRVVWLHNGEMKADGNAKEICEAYLALLYQQHSGVMYEPSGFDEIHPKKTEKESVDEKEDEQPDTVSTISNSQGFGDGGAEIFSCSLHDEDGQILTAISGGETVDLKLSFRANKGLSSVIAGFIVKDRLGQYIFGENTFQTTIDKPPQMSEGEIASAQFRFTMPTLAPGTYTVTVAVASGTTDSHVQHHWLHEGLVFSSSSHIDTGVIFQIPVESELRTLTGHQAGLYPDV